MLFLKTKFGLSSIGCSRVSERFDTAGTDTHNALRLLTNMAALRTQVV